ncbi:MAG: hypothetical protein ABII79_13520 [bacterium]
MIIKTFIATSATAARKKVRSELGCDAIVLQTRQDITASGLPRIEITACLERPTVGRAEIALPDNRPAVSVHSDDAEDATSWLLPKQEPSSDRMSGAVDPAHGESEAHSQLKPTGSNSGRSRSPSDKPPVLSEVCRRMADCDFTDQFISNFAAEVARVYNPPQDLLSQVRQTLIRQVSDLVQPGLDVKPGDRLLFLGHPGAGKSSAMARLAVQLVTGEKHRVTLACIDFQKLAAHDELSGLAAIVGADVVDAFSTDAGQSTDNSIVLIDGPAVPRDKQELKRIRKMVRRVRPSHRLVVFSALTRGADLIELTTPLLEFNPTHLVMTMLDQTRRYGSVVTAAEALGVKLALVTDSPGGKGQIRPPQVQELIREITAVEVDHE